MSQPPIQHAFELAELQKNLGITLQSKGQLDQAIDAYRKSIALNPQLLPAHHALGYALNESGRFDESVAAFRQAIAINPTLPESHNNFGNALCDAGCFEEAIAAYRQAIALRPSYVGAHANLGNALVNNQQLDDAIAAFRQVIALRPGYASAHSSLGNALKDKGQFDEAIAAYRQALTVDPHFEDALNNLAGALNESGRLDQALIAYRRAIALNPNSADTYTNMGIVLKKKGQLDEAIAAHRHAITLDPNFPDAHNNLGFALAESGCLDDAIASFRQAIALRSAYAQAHSNLLFLLHYHPRSDAAVLTHEHRLWNRQHAQPLQGLALPHNIDQTPDRRLRIGYVSPDFRDHTVGRNLLPLFRHHDGQEFEITCYAHVVQPDAFTHEFQQHAHRWHDIARLSDERVANQIREDGIDILIDLALHSADNRLLVFARKPAPVQVSFAGYPGSTGLTSIDCRLSDPYLDPPGLDPAGADESLSSEKTIRLPDSFWCYDPHIEPAVPLNPLPALQSGVVTFGCLNRFCKINDGVLDLWAEVMRAVPASPLILLAAQGSHRQRTVDRLAQKTIDPARIEFVASKPHRAYLELYHRIDIGLDTFPYNGHTTSLDSLWMGVPVITLIGQTAVARAGWCQLSNLGLQELAAPTPRQFVNIATDLANDLPRLHALRSTLRQRMEQSPLMDAPKFARGIEAAYQKMWRSYCSAASTVDSRD